MNRKQLVILSIILGATLLTSSGFFIASCAGMEGQAPTIGEFTVFPTKRSESGVLFYFALVINDADGYDTFSNVTLTINGARTAVFLWSQADGFSRVSGSCSIVGSSAIRVGGLTTASSNDYVLNSTARRLEFLISLSDWFGEGWKGASAIVFDQDGNSGTHSGTDIFYLYTEEERFGGGEFFVIPETSVGPVALPLVGLAVLILAQKRKVRTG